MIDWQARLVLVAVALPAGVSLAAVPVVSRLCARSGVRAVLHGAALALPVAGASVALYGVPDEPWSYVAALPLAGVAGIAAYQSVPSKWSAWAGGLAIALGAVAALVPVLRTEPAWAWAAVALGAICPALCVLPVARRGGDGVVASLTLALGAACAAVVVAWRLGSVALASPLGATAAVLGAWSAVGRRRGAGAVPVLVYGAVAGPTVVVAWLYVVGDRPPLAAALAPVAAPVGVWISGLPPLRRRRLRAALAGLVASALLAALGLALALSDFGTGRAEPDPYLDLYSTLP